MRFALLGGADDIDVRVKGLNQQQKVHREMTAYLPSHTPNRKIQKQFHAKEIPYDLTYTMLYNFHSHIFLPYKNLQDNSSRSLL